MLGAAGLFQINSRFLPSKCNEVASAETVADQEPYSWHSSTVLRTYSRLTLYRSHCVYKFAIVGHVLVGHDLENTCVALSAADWQSCACDTWVWAREDFEESLRGRLGKRQAPSSKLFLVSSRSSNVFSCSYCYYCSQEADNAGQCLHRGTD